jgi:small subunit ribosomal protein S21
MAQEPGAGRYGVPEESVTACLKNALAIATPKPHIRIIIGGRARVDECVVDDWFRPRLVADRGLLSPRTPSTCGMRLLTVSADSLTGKSLGCRRPLDTRTQRCAATLTYDNIRNGTLQVFVRDNNVDQALRVLKKKMQREGVFREMKRRRFFEKPSERTVREKAEAVRRARKLARKQAIREGLIAAPPACGWPACGRRCAADGGASTVAVAVSRGVCRKSLATNAVNVCAYRLEYTEKCSYSVVANLPIDENFRSVCAIDQPVARRPRPSRRIICPYV